MINLSKFDSLFDLVVYFDTETKCRQFLKEQRWGNTVVCPYCGCTECYECGTDCKRFKCKHCHDTFSVRVGTIFEDSNIGLRKWFMAMYLISTHKKGVSSCQLAKDIRVTQKTAWFLLQKIRTLFAQDDAVAFTGTIECDEVYIGGKEKWKHKSMRTPHTQGRSTKTKTPVFGMSMRSCCFGSTGELEPMSYVHAFVVEKADSATVLQAIQQFCAEGSHILTDESGIYSCLESNGYKHDVVCHSAEEYADGCVFTNGIEAFWSHFRRMIVGCYHNVTDKYIQRYIDESAYRWNTRKLSSGERFSRMFKSSIGAVSYADVRCAA